METNKTSYNVDLVFCIDATGSMSHIIDLVKRNALNFDKDLLKAMDAKKKHISSLRIRIIAFRDYIADEEDAMLVTDFFALPSDQAAFSRCVNSIKAFGGGDTPEDGLEALAYAIHSPWDNQATKRRQVIAVWTDAGTHPLGYGSKYANYPTKMPKSFAELTNWWGDCQYSGYMDQNAKRLLLFAPDEPGWSTVRECWDNVIHYKSIAGEGLGEYDYKEIIDAISNSI